MLKLQPQRYINLFKTETAHSVIVYAICIEVTAPGEYIISEPRIVKITPKRQLALPGAVVSPFALSGAVSRQVKGGRLVSPFNSNVTFNKAEYLKWYKANAPNIFA